MKKQPMLSIVMLDDQRAFLDILQSLIEKSNVARICASFTDAAQALKQIPQLQPDVITVDVSMPTMNGIEVTKVLQNIYPEACVLAISGYMDGVYVRGMFDAGARGYVMKDNVFHELAEALQCIVGGDLWYGEGLDDVAPARRCFEGK